MNHCGNQQFSYAELDQMAATAEVLPPRLALSGVSAPSAFMAGPHSEVYYACQSTWSAGTGGLLNTGLLAQPAHSSMTCYPSVVNAR